MTDMLRKTEKKCQYGKYGKYLRNVSTAKIRTDRNPERERIPDCPPHRSQVPPAAKHTGGKAEEIERDKAAE